MKELFKAKFWDNRYASDQTDERQVIEAFGKPHVLASDMFLKLEASFRVTSRVKLVFFCPETLLTRGLHRMI
jgi:hypothetical protein